MMSVVTGIFWVYQGTVIGKQSSSELEQADSLGWIDSHWAHVEHWHSALEDGGMLNAAMGLGYDQVLRGRLLYSVPERRHVAYTDLKTITKDQKAAVKDWFGLAGSKVVFRHDNHYTMGLDDRYLIRFQSITTFPPL